MWKRFDPPIQRKEDEGGISILPFGKSKTSHRNLFFFYFLFLMLSAIENYSFKACISFFLIIKGRSCGPHCLEWERCQNVHGSVYIYFFLLF